MQILAEVMFVISVNAFKHYQTNCSPLSSSETAVFVQDNDCNFTEFFQFWWLILTPAVIVHYCMIPHILATTNYRFILDAVYYKDVSLFCEHLSSN